MAMLEIRNLDVYHGESPALTGIDLDVAKGQIVSILGANSAGKSTLLMTISGLLKARSGTIHFEGKRIDGLEPYKIVDLGVALVPEGRRVFSSLTVQENLFIGSFTPRARKKRDETIESVFDLFPILAMRRHQQGPNLSGGEQQMLSIGRALMSRPSFLIFDELSLGLTPLVVKDLYKAVKEINRVGVTVVLVEQDVKRSLKVANFTYILQEGAVALKGNPRFLSEEVVKKAYFGV